jgi:hypothetical protein
MWKMLSLPLLVCLFACSDDPFADLEEGWNHIVAGGETICSDGSEYSFWFRPGSTNALTVYMQGGGACWFGEICALDRSPTYDPAVDEEDTPAPRGIFDFDNAENPIAEHSVLFIPYCTGDVHVGDRVVTYEVEANDSQPARSFDIQHRGVRNAQAALDWLYARVTDPSIVLVTGTSAGALGSSFHAPVIAAHYSDARVEQLGDAAGGYRGDPIPSTLQTWGNPSVTPEWPEYADADSTDFVTYYIAAGTHASNLRLSQINIHADQVQLDFLRLEGIDDVPLVELLDANLAEISAALPAFRSYMIPGDTHGIVRSNEFYEVEVDGVRLRDWLAGLVAGEEIAMVACEECR